MRATTPGRRLRKIADAETAALVSPLVNEYDEMLDRSLQKLKVKI